MIRIEDIVQKKHQFFVPEGTRHPYIYPNGKVDVSGLGHNVILNGLSVEQVFQYLQEPKKYFSKVIPIFPEYAKYFSSANP